MIFDYKNELMHEYTALNTVRDSLKIFTEGIDSISSENDDEPSYVAPLNAILSCISGSHKLDHMRLCSDPNSRHTKVSSYYKEAFGDTESEESKKAIAMYQTAQNKYMVDGLKPYQFINKYLHGESLTEKQEECAVKYIEGIKSAFQLASQKYTLQIGQRLFRGATLDEVTFSHYQNSCDKNVPIRLKGYSSTSLSESVASSFAAFSYALRMKKPEEEVDNPHIPIVFELTNRKANLPFVLPDAFRRPERSQGQMELLLPSGLDVVPTYIDYGVSPVKIYIDIM